ncbi:GNAT family N-acetyltransferase [Alicyclobacillus herbarius]|uniref:GNAT family N-acetyltransferase n=1 Tax=Alicyclobacillus herbarius TaxID=122960 RepID=UPI00041C282D|nr:GNAT family N-acetyltransferase [Alicyclobacillus herbarius]
MPIMPSDDWELLNVTAAPAVESLAARLGWAFRRQQTVSLLQAGWVIGLRRNTQLLATAAVFHYDEAWASLGMVMVDPDVQRQGIGRRLVSACLERVRDHTQCISLVSTAAGYPLYQSLGFETLDTVYRYQLRLEKVTENGAGSTARHRLGTAPHADHARHTTRCVCLREEQWTDLVDLDRIAVGANRSRLYISSIEATPDSTPTRSQTALGSFAPDGRLSGVALVTAKPGALAVGPLIAASLPEALALLSAVQRVTHGVLRIDVPGSQTAFRHALEQTGWQLVMHSPLMTWHGTPLPGQRHLLYGLLDPALG